MIMIVGSCIINIIVSLRVMITDLNIIINIITSLHDLTIGSCYHEHYHIPARRGRPHWAASRPCGTPGCVITAIMIYY